MKFSARKTAAVGAVVVAIVAGLFVSSISADASITTSPSALDAVAVTTGGTAVVVVRTGEAANGCYIQNDPTNSNYLYVDPVNTANSSSPASTATLLAPGAVWNCPYNTMSTVTVTATDSGHKIYGVKY